MTDARVERLSVDDCSANVELSRSVGWKDLESEWRTLHAAANVWGVREGGRLIAQGACGDYGSGLTVAKMVVALGRQGSGLGRRVLEQLMTPARARGVGLGLCATEQGRLLYEKAGFSRSGEIVVLVGQVARAAAPSVVSVLEDASRAWAVERRFLACDRSRMLAARLVESCAAVQLERDAGFAMATPAEGGAVLGPVVADGEDSARELVLALSARLSGTIRIDVPAEQRAFRSWLVGLGLREVGRRDEMTWGVARAPWQVPQRFALASLAWG